MPLFLLLPLFWNNFWFAIKYCKFEISLFFFVFKEEKDFFIFLALMFWCSIKKFLQRLELYCVHHNCLCFWIWNVEIMIAFEFRLRISIVTLLFLPKSNYCNSCIGPKYLLQTRIHRLFPHLHLTFAILKTDRLCMVLLGDHLFCPLLYDILFHMNTRFI